MKPNSFDYTCKVTLPIKKDINHWFCGNHRPLNLQTRWDAFPMPLVDDVLMQLGKTQWFFALNLQFGFWQIKMALEDIHKFALITKFKLFDYTIMPFGMKNATNIFSRTMTEVFGAYLDKFLKVFMDDLNVHNLRWEEHMEHLWNVLLKLREVNLKFNLGKCELAKTSFTFLGHCKSWWYTTRSKKSKGHN